MTAPQITSDIQGIGITKGRGRPSHEHSPRKTHSNFFITINTNMVVSDAYDPEFKEKHDYIQKSLEELFSSNNILKYIEVKKPGDTVAKIDYIKIKGKAEIGPVQHRLHYHILILTFHSTKLLFNLNWCGKL